MKGHNPIEVAKTVLEVADVAWSAVERCHHHTHSHTYMTLFDVSHSCEEDELKSLRSENERLKRLLEQNLMLLQSMSQFPSLLEDCPPDGRIVEIYGQEASGKTTLALYVIREAQKLGDFLVKNKMLHLRR